MLRPGGSAGSRNPAVERAFDEGEAVLLLNELEYIRGRIFANIWGREEIAVIDPADGRVTNWIDLSGLVPQEEQPGVLNGIAFDDERSRLFVTGKNWARLFEIRLRPLDAADAASRSDS